MAQAKAKRSTRTKGSSEAERIEREYRRLALAIGDIQEFRLYLATYNDPQRRDGLIERLVVDSEQRKLKVTRLDVSGSDREVSLVRVLREHIEETSTPSGWHRTVMVVGIETLLDYVDTRGGLAVLETANLQRDAFPKAVPVPVVIWLSPLASSAFPKAAPDLWHWRGASFDFTGHTESRADLLRDMIKLPSEQLISLPHPQPRERAAMLEELIAELDQSGPPKSPRESEERASLLIQLGLAYLDLKRTSEALQVCGRALAIARKIGNRRGEYWVLVAMGHGLGDLGDLQRALARYREAGKIAGEIGDRGLEAHTLSALANIYRDLGEPQRTIEHLQQALTIAREIGDRTLEAQTLYELADGSRRLGERRRALQLCKEALGIAREIGDQALEGRIILLQGATYHTLGDLRKAIDQYQQALQRAREIGNRPGEAWIIFALSDVYRGLAEPERAIKALRETLAIAEEIGEANLADSARAELGELQAKHTEG
jgi:tetratricopeptide (TPR) repeat protein